MQQVIILGAGKSKQFIKNPATIRVDAAKCALDWLLSAFDKEKSHYTFIGGYKFDEIAHKYPCLHFVFNPDWEKTACDVSLQLSCFDTKNPAFVCYSDLLLRSQLIKRMEQASAETGNDIVIAIDSNQTLLNTKENCEIIQGTLNGITQKYPFIGCIYLKPSALKILKENNCFCNQLEEHRLSGIVDCLIKKNLKINYVDANELWSEVLNPLDVAKFILTTKAQTLQALRKKITTAKIADQIHFSIQQWKENSEHIIQQSLNVFGNKALVVRSSSLQEDSFSKANAGKFESILNVEPTSDCLKKAIETVIASYGTTNSKDQVLIQPMLHDVKTSGVVFTRTLNYGAPYYIVNYDEADTAAVTSGASTQDQIFYHWKYAKIPAQAPDFYPQLFKTIQEIEQLTQFDALDIEFAVTNNNQLYIFQVRPLASQHLREISDHQLQKHLDAAAKRFIDWQNTHPNVQGQETIFGVMPDWNPAEIVGTKPHTLAISLYQNLITNDIWAQQRTEFGYKDVRPYPLIVNFVGHPYVDVRASIHSFLPATLSDQTTQKLVTFFVQRLKNNPAWHDKLEFMVMPTCYTIDFEERWHNLLINEAQLSIEEYSDYKNALLKLTQSAFEKCNRHYAEMAEIEERFKQIQTTNLSTYDKIYVLIQTCRIGTLNFSHLARCGFIASSFLKSFVAKGILSESEKTILTSNIQTITGQFFAKMQEAVAGKISKQECIEVYGHLRPGTYDITSPTYRSNPDKYLFSNSIGTTIENKQQVSFDKSKLKNALEQTLGISLETFEQFLQQAIAGREYSKFIFTRYISLILDTIEEIGKENGFSTEEMSHLPINIFEDIRNGLWSFADCKRLLRNTIEFNKEYYRIIQCIELPPLITNQNDFYSFFIPKTIPNFIGNQCIETELIYLQNSNEIAGNKLKNKIILIEKADPGFDWIFNYGIAGLITAYGGPNSHMAIRSAEFHLPASIGIGESLFNQLKQAQLVQLDCTGHRLNIIR